MPPTKFQVMQVLNEIFEGAELICLGGTDIKVYCLLTVDKFLREN